MVIVDPSIQFVINLLEHFAQKLNVPNARDHLNRLLPTDAIIVAKMAAPIDCWAVYEMLCSHTQLVIKTLTILTTATSICSYLKSLLPVLLGTEIDSLKCDVYPLEYRDRLLAEIASDNEDAGNDEESSDVADVQVESDTCDEDGMGKELPGVMFVSDMVRCSHLPHITDGSVVTRLAPGQLKKTFQTFKRDVKGGSYEHLFTCSMNAKGQTFGNFLVREFTTIEGRSHVIQTIRDRLPGYTVPDDCAIAPLLVPYFIIKSGLVNDDEYDVPSDDEVSRWTRRLSDPTLLDTKKHLFRTISTFTFSHKHRLALEVLRRKLDLIIETHRGVHSPNICQLFDMGDSVVEMDCRELRRVANGATCDTVDLQGEPQPGQDVSGCDRSVYCSKQNGHRGFCDKKKGSQVKPTSSEGRKKRVRRHLPIRTPRRKLFESQPEQETEPTQPTEPADEQEKPETWTQTSKDGCTETDPREAAPDLEEVVLWGMHGAPVTKQKVYNLLEAVCGVWKVSVYDVFAFDMGTDVDDAQCLKDMLGVLRASLGQATDRYRARVLTDEALMTLCWGCWLAVDSHNTRIESRHKFMRVFGDQISPR